MIIIEVSGGLGNQLQQYALYRKFLDMGKEARLDISWFESDNQRRMLTKRRLELDCLEGLPYSACTTEEKTRLIGNSSFFGKVRRKLLPFTVHYFKESQMYHPELLGYDHMYISGYFACEKYYADILHRLRKEIRFPKGGNPFNYEICQQMKNSQSISVHIRRGDYLNPENQYIFGNICTDAYYEQAIRMIKEEIPGAHFYIFSDDIAYIKKTYSGREYTVVDINHGEESFYDIWLMSNCKHNICANSTFSFWGARLNDNARKIMIRPSIHKNSQIFNKEEMEKLWQGWRFIDPQGRVL